MTARKIDTSTGAGGAVAVARVRFDTHLSTCDRCTDYTHATASLSSMCQVAQELWRKVVLAAARNTRVGA